jgi:hypothetical protein
MGFTMFTSLMIENGKCREEWVDVAIPLLVWGASAGGFGSLVCLLIGPVLSKRLSFVAARFNLGGNHTTDTLLLRDEAHSAGSH